MTDFTKTSRLLGILLIAAFVLQLVSPAKADSKNYKAALSSTVWILSKSGGEMSSGSGVLIDADKKLIITTLHVVGDASSAIVFFPETKDGKTNTTREYYAENAGTLGIRGVVLSADHKRDLALIQLDRLPAGTKAVTFAPASAGPGDALESVGNPGSTDALWVYTSGTVRAVYKKQFRTGAGEHDFTVVESQSPINTGDSGGPMFNTAGELVAISQSISPNARLVSYAVDISEVRDFLATPYTPNSPVAVPPMIAANLAPKKPVGPTEIKIDLEGGLKQSVFVTDGLETYENAEYRKVWALGGILKTPPKPELALKMLDQNGQAKLGSWSVEKSPKGDFFLVFTAKVDATVSPDTLKSTVDYVAKVSALMAKDLASAPAPAPAPAPIKKPATGLSGWVK
jgi:serine protease Do